MSKKSEVLNSGNFMSALIASISLIPVVGSAINEVLFDRRSRIKQDRINSFVTELGKSVQKIDESKIDQEYLKSDEFSDIVESTFKKVSEFGTTTRIKRFKNILLNQTVRKCESSIIETYLNIITTLSEKQLLLLEHYQLNEKNLKRIYRRLEEEESRGSRFIKHMDKEVTLENADVEELRKIYKDFIQEMYVNSGIRKGDDIDYINQDLVSKSLLKDESFTIKNKKPNEILLPTKYSKQFVNFIIEFNEN